MPSSTMATYRLVVRQRAAAESQWFVLLRVFSKGLHDDSNGVKVPTPQFVDKRPSEMTIALQTITPRYQGPHPPCLHIQKWNL